MSLIVTQPVDSDYSGLERRAFPRRRARGATAYRLDSNRFIPARLAKLVDMCQGGIGIVVRDPLKEGDKIEVEITPPIGGHSVKRLAEVRWIRLLPDGLYRVGCSFEHRLGFAEIQGFVY
jgi:hypothetical protein